MGEIADDMIEGACCAQCGAYFEEKHGYPVRCENCYITIIVDNDEMYPKATKEES